MSESHDENTNRGFPLDEEHRGLIIKRRAGRWYVYGRDDERISNGFKFKEEAKDFIDRHIRRGGT